MEKDFDIFDELLSSKDMPILYIHIFVCVLWIAFQTDKIFNQYICM